jgi:hypothetical protein
VSQGVDDAIDEAAAAAAGARWSSVSRGYTCKHVPPSLQVNAWGVHIGSSKWQLSALSGVIFDHVRN